MSRVHFNIRLPLFVCHLRVLLWGTHVCHSLMCADGSDMVWSHQPLHHPYTHMWRWHRGLPLFVWTTFYDGHLPKCAPHKATTAQITMYLFWSVMCIGAIKYTINIGSRQWCPKFAGLLIGLQDIHRSEANFAMLHRNLLLPYMIDNMQFIVKYISIKLHGLYIYKIIHKLWAVGRVLAMHDSQSEDKDIKWLVTRGESMLNPDLLSTNGKSEQSLDAIREGHVLTQTPHLWAFKRWWSLVAVVWPLLSVYILGDGQSGRVGKRYSDISNWAHLIIPPEWRPNTPLHKLIISRPEYQCPTAHQIQIGQG